MTLSTITTAADLINDMPILEEGFSTLGVTILQQLLILEGYGANLPVTGFFGTETETAVLTFQQAVGLEQDGIVGPDTWNALAQFQAIGD
ncbi:MAG TPA: peptidoglycan-binding domain-containing protein [Coleofasciculaceae cyanobacterium]